MYCIPIGIRNILFSTYEIFISNSKGYFRIENTPPIRGLYTCHFDEELHGIDVSLFLKKILNWQLYYSRLMSFDPFIRCHEQLHANMKSSNSLERKKGENKYLELRVFHKSVAVDLIKEHYKYFPLHLFKNSIRNGMPICRCFLCAYKI